MTAVRTTRKFTQAFILAVVPERAWRAFTEPRELEAWYCDRVHEFEVRPGGRIRYEMVGVTIEGTIEEVQAPTLLRRTVGRGILPGETVITTTFEACEGGTKVTVTQSGFGDGGDWLTQIESHTLGGTQLLADLALYLRTGISFKRKGTWRVRLGARFTETPAGLEVVSVDADGFAGRVGMQPGDLFVQLGRAPIFDRSDLWLLQREHDPGEEMEAVFIRGHALQRAKAVL
jgi:uncharacterized protein YndB with AHSA1/START domain